MNLGIERAIEFYGSMAALARSLSITAPAVHEWRSGARPVPVERCVQIERMTKGAATRVDLRPSDWHRIWPELIGAPGAPAIPTEEKAHG